MEKGTEQHLIKISATARASKKPDQVELDVSFYGECDERADCITQYNKDIAAVLSALENVGFQKDSIKQSGFKVFPHKEGIYEKVGEDEDDYYYRTEMIKGYEYESHATVLMEADEHLYGNAWLALLETDGSFSFQFDFGLKDEESVEKELLANAVEQARSRAEILASAAGAKLGEIASIEHTIRNAFDGYPDDLLRCGGSAMGASSKKDMIPDFNPDDITVYCSIDAAWLIEKA